MNDIFSQKLRVVYYARVSTEKDGQLNSLDNQIAYFENLIKSNKNWTFCGGYVDEGISGTSVKARKNFLKMIDAAKNSKFDLIITKEISRFSRNTLDSIKYTRELLKYGTAVYFQSDNINTLSPDSELRLTIMSAIAQDEVRKISERIKFGFKQSVSDGKVLGTGHLIGYTKKDGTLFIDDEKAKIVRKIFDLYAVEKIGIRQISKELEKMGCLNSNGNPYTFSTIKNIITNPKYKGFYCGHKYENIDIRYGKKTPVEIKNQILKKDKNVPAIVSEELWDAANELLKIRSKKFAGRQNQQRYPYSGKIFCKTHDAVYHRNVFNKTKEAWNCSVYKRGGKSACDNFVVYTDEINNIIFEILKSEFNFEKVCSDLLKIYKKCKKNDIDDNSFELKSMLKKLYAKREKLLSIFLDELITIDEYKNKQSEIDKCIKDIKEKMNQAKNGTPILDKTGIISLLNEKNDAILSAIIEKIYVSKTSNAVVLDIIMINNAEYKAIYNKSGSRILGIPNIKKIAG